MEYGTATRAPVLPPDLDRHTYLNLTSYRRDGRGAATPVWPAGREVCLAIAPAGA